MTSLYPSPSLYPGSTVFPGIAFSGAGTSGIPADGASVSIGTLSLTGTDANGTLWKTLQPLDGWDSGPASSKTQTQKTRAGGAWSGPRNLGPRIIALSGLILAQTPDALQYAVDQLNAAVSLEDTILTVTRGASTRSAIVSRQDVVMVQDQTDVLATWSFQVSADDPRKFAAALSATTTRPSVTGGFTFPVVLPLNINSTVNNGVCNLANPGNANGPLVIRFTGPLGAPQVTHAQSGLIWSSSQSVTAGDYLQVDMEAQTVTVNGVTSRNAYITSRDWFGFLPGLNSYYLTAASGYGSMSVTGTPSWL